MQSTLDITELYQYGERVAFQKGEYLAQSVAEETSGDIYILCSGICALSSISSDGRETTYLYFKKQQFVGFVPLMNTVHLNYYGKNHFQSWRKRRALLIVSQVDNFKNYLDFHQLLA